jgi:hypothetical protein
MSAIGHGLQEKKKEAEFNFLRDCTSKIHTDVLTQSDTVLSHRITAKMDTDALGTLMQSYMRGGLTEQLDTLPRVKGVGVIFDDTNEKLFPMRVRPRFTWHGGESPSAIPKKKKYFE